MDPLHDLLQYLNGPQTDTGLFGQSTEAIATDRYDAVPHIDSNIPEQMSSTEVDEAAEELDYLLTHEAQRLNEENASGPIDDFPSAPDLDSAPSFPATQETHRLAPAHRTQLTNAELPPTYVPHQVPQVQIQQNVGPMVRGTQLIPVDNLPDSLRSVFSFRLFNVIQSRCFEIVYKTDDNLVLSAPTGSGKTAVFELAICRVKLTQPVGDFKIVYISPTKALCTERRKDWESRFQHTGLRCVELTGDTYGTDHNVVQSADVIITTPEKWEATTRKWSDHARLFRGIRLVLIDEVHILKEDRGATLEAVIARMKLKGIDIRFIALSATIPNAGDVASWLNLKAGSTLPARCQTFGEDYRPVPVQKHVIGLDTASEYGMESACEARLPDILATYSEGKSALIFCGTRTCAVKTAEKLVASWRSQPPSRRGWAAPPTPSKTLDPDLSALLACGIAYHHAGLQPTDRTTVEDDFRRGALPIVCCTTTLAVGINLPCYLVVIKNTMGWQGGFPKEYSDLELMQMLGRAGRPQYDRNAVAVILTRREKVSRYKKLVSGEDIVESSLHQNLIEYLNAEIGMGTVFDLNSAKLWMQETFLAIRLQQNPKRYKLVDHTNAKTVEELVSQICERDIALLQDSQLVREGPRFRCTEVGNAMARYCVKFETMQHFAALPDQAKISDVLSVLAASAEFHDVRWRAGEKQFYRTLNAMPDIKFPIKVDLALAAHKRSIIIQAHLGRVDLPTEPQLLKHKRQYEMDRRSMFGQIHRLVRCVIDCQVYRQDAVGTRNALSLARSLGAQSWDDTPLQLIQIPSIGPVAIRKLIGSHIDSIEALDGTEPHRINAILSRGPGYGETLLNGLKGFPKLRLCIKYLGEINRIGKLPKVSLKVEVGFLNEKLPEIWNKKRVFCCFFAERSDGQLLDFQRFSAATACKQDFRLSVEITDKAQKIACSVMCDEIAGTLRSAEYKPTLSPEGQRACELASEPKKASASEKKGIEDRTSSTYFSEAKAKRGPPLDVFDSSIDDVDMLAAATEAENQQSPSLLEYSKQYKPGRSTARRPLEPIQTQLSTVKWDCNHKCKDKTSCKHLCCREGLERPAKPRKAAPLDNTEIRTTTDKPQSKPKVDARHSARTADAVTSTKITRRTIDSKFRSSRTATDPSEKGDEWFPYAEQSKTVSSEVNSMSLKSVQLPSLKQQLTVSPVPRHSQADISSHDTQSSIAKTRLVGSSRRAVTPNEKDSNNAMFSKSIMEVPIVDLSMIEASESDDERKTYRSQPLGKNCALDEPSNEGDGHMERVFSTEVSKPKTGIFFRSRLPADKRPPSQGSQVHRPLKKTRV